MRIKPRQQLLDLWRATTAFSAPEGSWRWGGRDGSNSISDAEQLLCLLYPATAVDTFALHRPDDMADDVRTTLRSWGTATRIGSAVVNLIDEYLRRNADADGEPIFSAGSYLRADEGEPTSGQRGLEIVDSYSMSLSLCIAALRFLRGFERSLASEVRLEARILLERIPPLTESVGRRLTAAMTGLLRSFVIHTPPPDSEAEAHIVRMLNQGGEPVGQVISRLSARLERLRVQAANEVWTGVSTDAEVDIADDRRLFECGWSWGIARSAQPIDSVTAHTARAAGHAEPKPHLYFTAVALDGIADLSSQRIRELDLLTEEQRRLADALQLRFELTRNYWSEVARFGNGRWPLEDMPWQTSGGEESDYFSLVVTAMVIQDLVHRDSAEDLRRAVVVFQQLALRGRITSRLTDNDPAGALHHPGVRLRLVGSETVDGGPALHWDVPDFATVLLKRCLQAARLRSDVRTRDYLMELAEATMEQLAKRRLREGPAAGLWDAPAGDRTDQPPEPSWFISERVMECLVIAHDTFTEPPLTPPSVLARAVDLLSEAEHLLNREELQVESYADTPRYLTVERIRQALDRARQVLAERPGTAHSLAAQALVQLDELVYARQDATR